MQNNVIVKKALFDTITFYRSYGHTCSGKLTIDYNKLGFKGEDQVVATGYGKITVQVEGALQYPEIQAHAKGAVFQTGKQDFTLLDVGGQDTKVVKVEAGRPVDFLTNDRCAASSGRYVENMAAVLGLSLEEMSNCWQDPVELSSTCAVFGETEIIGLIVEGYPLARLAAGVNYALYRRVAAMLKKLYSSTVILAGGGALNRALGMIINREMGARVMVLPEPQFNGAIGCCVYREEI